MSESGKLMFMCYIAIFSLFCMVSSVTGYNSNRNNVPADPKETHDEATDPCSSYNPRKPNFSRPGRRLSEISLTLLRNAKTADSIYGIRVFAIGGRNTEPGEFPHMGAIGWKAAVGTWRFNCGGSLISPKFVLTAGHCSYFSDTTVADPEPKIVRLGDKNIIDVESNGMSPTDAKIIRIIVHPWYRPPKRYHDIALMELEEHVVFSKYIQPACLWPLFDTSSLGTTATLTGWGVVETVHRTTSPELQAADVDFINPLVCDHLLMSSRNRNFFGVIDNQLCAGNLAGGIDACQGDSGGPLQVKIPLPNTTEGNMHYVVGVTSFGIGCALPNLPGIYTRVSMYLDWIESIVWPLE